MRIAALLAVALTMAGCASSPTISFVDNSRYDPAFAVYGARSGEMALVVLGNPTGEPQATVNAAVAEGLRGTHPNHRVMFVPSASTAATGYRTVVVFGGTNANEICSLTDPRGGGGGGDRVPAAAAFCFDQRLFSYAQGTMPGIEKSSDPVFGRMMTQLGIAIFPRRLFNGRGNCQSGFGC
jgi:hypothetical protein